MEMTSGTRAIDKIHRRRDRYEIPDWQRKEVWNKAKKRRLIDSILRGWKLPKFYFLMLSEEPEEYEVVDGQQRLTAMFEFFDDELDLTKKSADEFGGAYYSDLPQAHQDTFDDFEVEYDVIKAANEKEIKEFFQRLQEGLPLTSSEKLNSVHSKLRDFTKKLAKHNFFHSKVQLADKRYAHFDVVSKVAAIETDGIDAGLRYDDLKETFESQESFSSRSQVAKRLQNGFDYLDRIFESRSTILRKRTIVQSIATLVMRIVQSPKGTGHESQLYKFFTTFVGDLSTQVELGAAATDQDYVAFQRTVNANVLSGARTRHEILLRKLLIFDPASADLLGPGAVAETGVNRTIREAADSIATVVHDKNADYSGKHGEDLFKATNKTTRAMTRLAKPISTYSKYKTLIEDLYFLFHEGVGSRLSEKDTPQSFADVSLLRTSLQHDVDHGRPGAVRKKIRKIGKTFRLYAGAASPEGLDPALFPLVQANLLSTLLNDLRALKV